MEPETKLRPLPATTLYNNFENFIAHYERMNTRYRFDSIAVQMLVRLARNDFEKAKRVYQWAVRVPFMRHMGAWYDEYSDGRVVSLSPEGLEQVEIAASRFGQNPQVAITLIEGIFVLEKTASWAPKALQDIGIESNLDEFRCRSDNDDEVLGKLKAVDDLYDRAISHVNWGLPDYIEARNIGIMLSITALADGCDPTEEELCSIMSGRTMSRREAKTLRDRRDDIRQSVSDPRFAVEWVLGKHQKEIPF